MNRRVKAGGLLVIVVAVLAIGSQGAAAPGGGQLWVTGQDGSRIHVVHGIGEATDTIQLPLGTSPHFARLSPSGRYVYVPSLGYGTITVIRASDREIVDVIDPEPSAVAMPPAVNSNPGLPGGLGTHDAKPSPDGSIVLTSQWSSNRIYKIAADEANESWSVAQQSDPLPGRPICFVFNPRGEKAYVGLFPGTVPGLTPPNALILVVDVETLTVIKSLPVIGGWSCSWAQTHDGSTTWLTTNAPGGRVYRLDMEDDTLELFLATGAEHVHGMGMSPNEQTLYLSSREDDTLRIVDIASATATSMSLDATPGVPDRPDSVAVQGDNVWVTLKSTGKLARVNANQESAEYIELEDPCPGALPAPANSNLCYAVHSVDGSY